MPRHATMRTGLLFLLLLCATIADASEKPTVRGRLLASNGEPLRDAYVSLMGHGTRFRHTTNSDGRFSFVVDTTGGYWLWLTGVHHQTLLVPLLIEAPIELEARLSAAGYLPVIDSVGVVGDFNDFSPKAGVFPMTARADGRHEAVIETSADSLRYQLVGVQVEELPLEGTQADRYEFDRDRPLLGNKSGKYLSVVATRNGRATIVFDPDDLPRSRAEGAVMFQDPGSIPAGLFAIKQDTDERKDRAYQAYRAYAAVEKDPGAFDYDWSAVRIELARQIDDESNDFLRQYRLINYFELDFPGEDSLRARRVLEDVPPTSPLWSLVWGGPQNLFMTITVAAKAPRQAMAYADHVMEEHSDPSVRAAFLFDALAQAHETGDAERAVRYYTRLTEEFPDNEYATLANTLYDSNRQIKEGNAAPKFSLPSLDDSTVTYTDETFRGKIYLIDLWAVWCGPCVREMKYLHEVYETYRKKGFEILSISLDATRQDVAEFREKRWPMPWNHAFAGRRSWNETAQVFEIAGIPKPILIDANGVIVATGWDLRGTKLKETLTRVFE